MYNPTLKPLITSYTSLITPLTSIAQPPVHPVDAAFAVGAALNAAFNADFDAIASLYLLEDSPLESLLEESLHERSKGGPTGKPFPALPILGKALKFLCVRLSLKDVGKISIG